MGQIGCLVVFLVGLSLGLGMLIDNFLGTDGIFTVLLMLGSVPITLFLVIRVSMSAAKRAQEQFDQKTKEEASTSDVSSDDESENDAPNQNVVEGEA